MVVNKCQAEVEPDNIDSGSSYCRGHSSMRLLHIHLICHLVSVILNMADGRPSAAEYTDNS